MRRDTRFSARDFIAEEEDIEVALQRIAETEKAAHTIEDEELARALIASEETARFEAVNRLSRWSASYPISEATSVTGSTYASSSSGSTLVADELQSLAAESAQSAFFPASVNSRYTNTSVVRTSSRTSSIPAGVGTRSLLHSSQSESSSLKQSERYRSNHGLIPSVVRLNRSLTPSFRAARPSSSISSLSTSRSASDLVRQITKISRHSSLHKAKDELRAAVLATEVAPFPASQHSDSIAMPDAGIVEYRPLFSAVKTCSNCGHKIRPLQGEVCLERPDKIYVADVPR